MIESPKKNINHIDLVDNVVVGEERRAEILSMPFDKTPMLPKPVVYKDIDDSFKEWVKSLRMTGEDGTDYPTMVLFSNQRFSEYSQSWQHVDENNNLMLNFKTVTRDNNPQYGRIHNGLWNIPGERFYRIKRDRVLDENGTESFVDLSMRQPMSVDLMYKVSIFTNKYEDVNKFNTIVNKDFSSRQRYITPNGYYMPMVLESISDESEYSIDDRQFYSQTYQIRVMAFILEEKDFRVTEVPLKRGISFTMARSKGKTPEVIIDDEQKDDTIVLSVSFPALVNTAEFVSDEDIKAVSFEYDNVVRGFRVFLNDTEVDDTENLTIHEGDTVRFMIRHRNPKKESVLTINGYNPRIRRHTH